MTDVLTWTVERRLQPAERAEPLRKELAETDAEVARPEAAEVVFGCCHSSSAPSRRQDAPSRLIQVAFTLPPSCTRRRTRLSG